ncbi:MAG: SO_0444 family Cu/Zn efflux transporter [bacterium]
MAEVLNALLGVFRNSWGVLSDSGTYVIFGLAVAGLINVFAGSQKIVRHLGERSFKSVLLSSVFGVPLPLCSCGVVPTAISLHQKGASKGATVSFLVSTPETGVDSIAISWALLDPLMTICRPIAAFLTAIFAGSFENLLSEKRSPQDLLSERECIVCGEEGSVSTHHHSLGVRLAGGIRYAFMELLGDISRWFLVGVVIAGAIAYFVPEGLITERAGYGWPAMFMMALVGIPLYMCATSSTPIAAVLIAKGVSPGAALVFLLTGPVTNAASLTVVARFLGRRATVVYLGTIFASSLLFGWGLNWIYRAFRLDATAIVGKGAEVMPSWLKAIAGIVLLLLMINTMIQERKKGACEREQKED